MIILAIFMMFNDKLTFIDQCLDNLNHLWYRKVFAPSLGVSYYCKENHITNWLNSSPIYKNIAVHCNLNWVDSLSFRFNSINYFLFQVAKFPVKLLRKIREP